MEDSEERFGLTQTGGLAKLCHANINGKDCGRFALKGRDFCARHGGRTPLGPDNHAFTTGLESVNRKRFSGLGKELLSRLEELRNDPDLFSLKDDAAYITALIDRRAEAAEEGLSVETLNQLRTLYRECANALEEGKTQDFDKAFEQLGGIIRQGISDAKSTDEVLSLIGKRVDIIEAEQRMTHAKAYTLEVDQAYALIQQVLKVVVDSVKDVNEMQAIRSGVQRLLRVYRNVDDIIDAEVVDEESPTEYQNAT
jgi:hypothetical protein